MPKPEPLLNQPAPEFSLLDQEGNRVTLKEYRGKNPVVLIFYPGDDTPGCTTQLCAIRDDWVEFQKYGVKVFGINHADAESHTKFWRHHGLKTPLLIDEGKRVSKLYGATKKFFKAEIINRTVVVIDSQGIIRYLVRGLPPNSEILASMNTIRCITLAGDMINVPVDQIQNRPAAYGFIVHDQKLLLYRAKGSGTLSLPGGKIEAQETAVEALAREVREEFGMKIKQPQPLFTDETYYYDERKQQGFHAVMQYFCSGIITDQAGPVVLGQPEIAESIWQPLREVRSADFHVSGRAAIEKFLAMVT